MTGNESCWPQDFVGRIVCGDCVEIMSKMPANAVTLTVTDIPYDVVNRDSNGLRNLDKGYADQATFCLQDFLAELVRVTSGSIYVWCGSEQVSVIRAFLVDSGLTTRLCIWEKSNPSPMNGQSVWLSGIECCVFGKKRGAVFNEHCKNTVWRFPTERGKLHPTQKSLKLFEYLISVSSNAGDIVFDPCCGSGTTAVAAVKRGRNFCCVDVLPECCEVSRRRVFGDDPR